MKSILLHIILFTMVLLPTDMAADQTLKIDPTIKKTKISIYPNPVQDVFQLSHPDLVKSISINSIAGREVKRFEVLGKNTFTIDDLSKGIYIVRLFDDNNEPIKVMRLNKA
ncbi:MAG: T9SS type A sorting domain-containing protein [Saprospiraceae bacterium]|nr:T9SS type A sorting domain-containing protein [Saprospiraceae bacterium]